MQAVQARADMLRNEHPLLHGETTLAADAIAHEGAPVLSEVANPQSQDRTLPYAAALVAPTVAHTAAHYRESASSPLTHSCQSLLIHREKVE
jgi:hypothetical protein